HEFSASAPWDYTENAAANGIVLVRDSLAADALVHAVGHYLGLQDRPASDDAHFDLDQRSRMADLGALYRPQLVERCYIWADADWSGNDGWRYSDWLKGWVETTSADWTYHLEHG